jgi:hypothetical protein
MTLIHWVTWSGSMNDYYENIVSLELPQTEFHFVWYKSIVISK